MTDLRLHANESPWGSAGDQDLDPSLWQYPDDISELEAALAESLGAAPQDIMLGNGSTELISLLIQALSVPGEGVATCAGSFVAYRSLARAAGRTLQLSAPHPGGGTDLGALRAAIDDRTRLVFIANPDNPSGTLLREPALRAFLESLPADGPVVVLDEAYREYVEDPGYPAPTALRSPQTVILRTFSKAYGLAGLRCGYALCPRPISEQLRAISGPFRVGRLTRAAALSALRDQDYLRGVVSQATAARSALSAALRDLGLPVAESHASFVMVDLGIPAAEAAAALLARGVRVCPLHTSRRPTSVRITVGRPEDHPRLLAALRAVLV